MADHVETFETNISDITVSDKDSSSDIKNEIDCTNGEEENSFSDEHISDSVDTQPNPDEFQRKETFYSDAAKYWNKASPTVNGMLGGFARISSIDITGSEAFLKGICKMKNPPGRLRVADCGAGIGRITKNLLVKHFAKVDLVEQCEIFLEKAKQNLKMSPKVGEFICSPLQIFEPKPGTYDVIWAQWVLQHLNDNDLEFFFRRMIVALKPNGVIVVKENMSQIEVEVDEQDSSITRPQALFLEIIEKSGLEVLKNVVQRNFPEALYQVRMILLRPKCIEIL